MKIHYSITLASLIILPLGLVSCGNIGNGSNTSKRGTLDIRQCRAGEARPISVLTAMRVISHHGFSVETVPDANICGAPDTIAVFDNAENRNYDEVLNTEGHINCGLREKPIYRNHAKIVPSEYANWNDLRYENLECGLEKTGAGATINGRERFREIFEQLKRE